MVLPNKAGILYSMYAYIGKIFAVLSKTCKNCESFLLRCCLQYLAMYNHVPYACRYCMYLFGK